MPDGFLLFERRACWSGTVYLLHSKWHTRTLRTRSLLTHSTFWHRRCTCFVIVLLVWFPVPAVAQISPGALSRPHQSLNGTGNCTACHKLGGGQATFRCVDCHSEIASRIASRKGLHASYNLNANSSQECVKCHSEHNGEDFPLIKWDTRTFNHQQTGYSLEGKHAGLACNRCHTAEHVSPSERSDHQNQRSE